jgi:hypothetical protein
MTFLRRKSRGHVVAARLGPLYTYFVAGAKSVQAIFRNSRSLSSDFLVLEVYKKVIGLPRRDIAIFEADDSGSAGTPLRNVPEKQRIWRQVHEAQSRNFRSGEPLNILTKVFTRNSLMPWTSNLWTSGHQCRYTAFSETQ